MLRIGEYNTLIVDREKDFGFYLMDKQSREDVLLPKSLAEGMGVEVGKEVTVFIYRDSKDRPIATFKKPLAIVGDVAYLKVVHQGEFGAFVDFGLDRDIFVPLKEQRYKLHTGKKYLFYIYVDKTGRLAATTDIDQYLTTDHNYNIGDSVEGIVYGFQTNNSAMVCVDNKYAGVILHNEYFTELNIGDKLTLNVINIYEDDKLGLSPRQSRKEELDILEKSIMNYLEGADGHMRFNDKSTPEELVTVFNTSKKNFKRALGVLMKKDLIYQNENGTYLK